MVKAPKASDSQERNKDIGIIGKWKLSSPGEEQVLHEALSIIKRSILLREKKKGKSEIIIKGFKIKKTNQKKRYEGKPSEKGQAHRARIKKIKPRHGCDRDDIV